MGREVPFPPLPPPEADELCKAIVVVDALRFLELGPEGPAAGAVIVLADPPPVVALVSISISPMVDDAVFVGTVVAS